MNMNKHINNGPIKLTQSVLEKYFDLPLFDACTRLVSPKCELFIPLNVNTKLLLIFNCFEKGNLRYIYEESLQVTSTDLREKLLGP